MNTPVCDFVRRYAEEGALRLHMPGHKGASLLGMEHLDITEIRGADSLYEADGIIRESEENASRLFGCPTFYSTEGSSQCIRAMLYLAVQHWTGEGKPRILAGRNAHKTFLSACALLDLEVDWLYGSESSYLSCAVEPQQVEAALAQGEKPAAVYLTSPDYLGNMLDIAAIARVCRRHDVLLLVDNAHGAYLKFLQPSRHPVDLGADLCCDSAHKTLPVLTGGAYLHIAGSDDMAAQAKNALALFGSTSPSYLILQSLDAVNSYLADGYSVRVKHFTESVAQMKNRLLDHGYALLGNETLKLTLHAKAYGYTGFEVEEWLRKYNIICEFADPDYLVLMFSPETGEGGLAWLENALRVLPRKSAIADAPPRFSPQRRVMSVRQAALSRQETLPVEQCLGRVLAAVSVGCPPAVPIVICGEEIDRQALECFRYYGIQHCTVVK